MTTRILRKLEAMFKASHWNTIEVTMKSTGLKIELTPHFDDFGATPDPRDIKHCAFITGSGEEDAIWYTGTPLAVAGYLANHDEIHRRWLSQAKELARMADRAHGEWTDDDWSDYSDLYKETYGRRPARHPDERYIVVEIDGGSNARTHSAANMDAAIDLANDLLAETCNSNGKCPEEYALHGFADKNNMSAWVCLPSHKWSAHVIKAA